MGIAGDIVLITVFSLACGIIAQRFNIPIILGYIVAGIILGPNTIGPTVSHIQDVEMLADIGIALLLFTVGLEFPIDRINSVKKIAILGTPLQMALCIFFGILVGKTFAYDTVSSIWFGSIISVSSTMVVLKVLSDRGLTGTLSSQVMTAVLIAQDLFIIPMMVILPHLRNLSTQFIPMVMTLGESLLLVGIFAFLGTKVLPSIVTKAAAARSQELFMVTVLALGLGMGYITHLVGLSFAFGAFIAGLILSRSDFNHQVLSSIMPMSNLFSLLFFVSVGLMIKPSFIADHIFSLLLLLFVIFLGKSLIMGLTTRLFGYINIMPLAVGLYMFPIGEFAFVLARLGKSCGALNENIYLTSVTLAAVSMTLTPLVSGVASPIYAKWRKIFPNKSDLESPVNNNDENRLKDHIVIIGYGEIGKFLCSLISMSKTPTLVIDLLPSRIRAAKDSGCYTLGGDATSDTILQAAQLNLAKFLVVTVSNESQANHIVRRVHRDYPNLTILASARSHEHMKELLYCGATNAFVPDREASLAMLSQTMRMAKISAELNDMVISYLRAQHYDPLLEENEELIIDDDKNLVVRNTDTGSKIIVYTQEMRQTLNAGEKI